MVLNLRFGWLVMLFVFISVKEFGLILIVFFRLLLEIMWICLLMMEIFVIRLFVLLGILFIELGIGFSELLFVEKILEDCFMNCKRFVMVDVVEMLNVCLFSFWLFFLCVYVNVFLGNIDEYVELLWCKMFVNNVELLIFGLFLFNNWLVGLVRFEILVFVWLLVKDLFGRLLVIK